MGECAGSLEPHQVARTCHLRHQVVPLRRHRREPHQEAVQIRPQILRLGAQKLKRDIAMLFCPISPSSIATWRCNSKLFPSIAKQKKPHTQKKKKKPPPKKKKKKKKKKNYDMAHQSPRLFVF